MSARRDLYAALMAGGPHSPDRSETASERIDAYHAEILTEVIDDLTNCLRLGGMTQRGLVLARKRLIARRDGDTPEPPRRNVRHPRIAERCREKPGEWLTVGSYSSAASAATTARMIQGAIVSRSSSATPYAPAGTFEARTAPDGERTRVEARYVGTAAEAGGDRG